VTSSAALATSPSPAAFLIKTAGRPEEEASSELPAAKPLSAQSLAGSQPTAPAAKAELPAAFFQLLSLFANLDAAVADAPMEETPSREGASPDGNAIQTTAHAKEASPQTVAQAIIRTMLGNGPRQTGAPQASATAGPKASEAHLPAAEGLAAEMTAAKEKNAGQREEPAAPTAHETQDDDAKPAGTLAVSELLAVAPTPIEATPVPVVAPVGAPVPEPILQTAASVENSSATPPPPGEMVAARPPSADPARSVTGQAAETKVAAEPALAFALQLTQRAPGGPRQDTPLEPGKEATAKSVAAGLAGPRIEPAGSVSEGQRRDSGERGTAQQAAISPNAVRVNSIRPEAVQPGAVQSDSVQPKSALTEMDPKPAPSQAPERASALTPVLNRNEGRVGAREETRTGTTPVAASVPAIAAGSGQPSSAQSGSGQSGSHQVQSAVIETTRHEARFVAPLASEIEPSAASSSPQRIAVRIENPGAAAIDLHVAGRGAQVHVEVRTNDAGMQAALREDLGSLVHSLDRAGYDTDSSGTPDWLARPTSGMGAVIEAAASSSGGHAMGEGRHHPSGDEQQPSSSGGEGGRQERRQQQQQQHSRERRPASRAWGETMETPV